MASKFIVNFLFCLCYILNRISFSKSHLSCKDDSGNNLDWYIIYKLPKLSHENPLIDSGEAHLFWGPNSTAWTFAKFSINSSSSAITQTLLPLYKNQTNEVVFTVLYNDEHPDDVKTLILGHTKGIVAFDSYSGIWLIHSVPKFPPPRNQSFSFPDSGLVYGQSFLCISVNFSSANSIGSLLLYDTPFIYDSFISDTVKDKIPFLNAVVQNKHVTTKPWNKTVVLMSMSGYPFQAFAKHKDYDKDLYSSWIAPYFQTSLLTETWQNGPSKLKSACSTDFTVENIKEITVDIAKTNFSSTHDHSKIAISKQADHSWVCIGDINRMDAQKRRGGGTVCLKNPFLWKEFLKLVSSIESCNQLFR